MSNNKKFSGLFSFGKKSDKSKDKKSTNGESPAESPKLESKPSTSQELSGSGGQSPPQPLASSKKKKPRKVDEVYLKPYEGEAPPPPHGVFEKTLSDFPQKIQDQVKKSPWEESDRELIGKYPHLLWSVYRFLHRDLFEGDDKNYPKTNKPESRPYAKQADIDRAMKEVQPLTQPVKKLFKGRDHAGTGGFGDVLVMKDLREKKKPEIAIKQLPHVESHRMQNNFTEVFFLSQCKHPNICSYLGAYLVDDPKKKLQLWILLEYMEGGTLAEAASSNALTHDHIAFTAREIMKGLKYLHDRKWVHRDLKSANVMMSIKGEIKLIDFGLCCDVSEGPVVKMLGSPYWIPPEMVWDLPHSFPADVWSMGVCLLELFLTNPPHASSGARCMFLAATKGLVDQLPDTCNELAKNFMTRVLTVDYRKRPTIDVLLEDPWINRENLDANFSNILREIFVSNAMNNLGFGM